MRVTFGPNCRRPECLRTIGIAEEGRGRPRDKKCQQGVSSQDGKYDKQKGLEKSRVSFAVIDITWGMERLCGQEEARGDATPKKTNSEPNTLE